MPHARHAPIVSHQESIVMRLAHTCSIALLLLTAYSASVSATVYKCIDADGRVTYTNDSSLARGCEALSQDQPVSSVPAPARRPGSAPPSTPPRTSNSPSDFPKVTPDTQRARDDTRRQVLETELKNEEQSLSEAQAALAEQESIRLGDERNYQRVLDRLQPFKDKVELHQRNIEALRREIGRLR